LIPAEFDFFYGEMHSARWPALRQSLLGPEVQVARWNQFAEPSPPAGEIYFPLTENREIPRDAHGLLRYYVMDPASIAPAQALAVEDGDQVLDMCAAPGGKSLILAEALKNSGELIANEVSEARRERLKKVIQQYIPRDVRDRMWVTGRDGGQFARSHPEYFDRILIDAPCSGERHLMQNSSELSEWKKNRSEKLAQRQYALLTAALVAAKPGGRIVYSTCSVSNLEDDLVIDRLSKKKEGQFQVLDTLSPIPEAEKTKNGFQIWPDRCHQGPIYYAVLQKNQ